MRISDWSSDVCSSDLKPEQSQKHDQSQRHDQMQTLQCRQLHQLGVPGGGSWLLHQLQQACAHRGGGVGAVGGDQGGAAFLQVSLHHAVDQFDAAQVAVGVGFELGSASCRERVCKYV